MPVYGLRRDCDIAIDNDARRSQQEFLKQPRILLASTDSDSRQRLAALLARAGYAVRLAADTAEVISEFRELLPPIAERGVAPGLLVIEHAATEINTLKLVRAAAALRISVVVIGLGDASMRGEAYAMGATVLSGGFSVGDILSIIRTLAPARARGVVSAATPTPPT